MSHGRKTKCRKGCCWTPFEGVCGKQGNCACHSGYREREEDVAAVVSLEQARLTAARRLELPAWQRTEPRRKGRFPHWVPMLDAAEALERERWTQP